MRIPKTLNIYWVVATALAFWFLFLHTPPVLRHRSVSFWKDVPFCIHVFCAAGIYLACIHNSLLTPSIAKDAHVWVGRVGMVLGVISFLFGLYLSVVRLLPQGGDDATFAIAVTIGGVFQLVAQFLGYRAIRKYRALREELESRQATKATSQEHTILGDHHSEEESQQHVDDLIRQRDDALRKHIGSMLGLFVCACGIPAAVRILEDLQQETVTGFVVLIGSLNIWTALYGRSFLVGPPPEATNNQAETPLLLERVRQVFYTR